MEYEIVLQLVAEGMDELGNFQRLRSNTVYLNETIAKADIERFAKIVSDPTRLVSISNPNITLIELKLIRE